MEDYKNYLDRFEKEVIIRGFLSGSFNKAKQNPMIVPLKKGSLYYTDFGSFLGQYFESNLLLAVNYYGLFKLSNEIKNAKESVRTIFAGVKTIISPVIYFNSIKIEFVREISPDLFDGFPDFKKRLIELRWGSKNPPRKKAIQGNLKLK